MAALSVAAQRAASWSSFYSAVTLARRRTATSAFTLSDDVELLAKATRSLRFRLYEGFAASGLQRGTSSSKEARGSSARQQRLAPALGDNALGQASAEDLLDRLRGPTCQAEAAFDVLDELESRSAIDHLLIHDITLVLQRLGRSDTRSRYDRTDLLHRVQHLDNLAVQLDGAGDLLYNYGKLVFFAKAGFAQEAGALWQRQRRLGIRTEGSHALVLAAFQAHLAGRSIDSREARNVYLPLIYDLIEDGLAHDLDISPFRTLLLSLLRTIGDLKAVSQIAASVYGVDMAIPARPQKSEGLVPLTAAVVEELLRANLELDERRGLSKALALFEILTTMETAAPVEPFRLSEELDEPTDVMPADFSRMSRTLKSLVENERQARSARSAALLPPSVEATPTPTFVAVAQPAEVVVTVDDQATMTARGFELLALRDIGSRRMSSIVDLSFDTGLASRASYEVLLEACAARRNSALAQTLSEQLGARAREQVRTIRRLVQDQDWQRFSTLFANLHGRLLLPTTHHIRLALDSISQDDSTVLFRTYSILNGAHKTLAILRLEAEWLEKKLVQPGFSRGSPASLLNGYIGKLRDAIADLSGGLDVFDADIRFGLATMARNAHAELQAVAPGAIPVRDQISTKGYFYALAAGDLVRYQVKYFDVAMAASRRRWRDGDAERDAAEFEAETALMGAMAGFDDRLSRFRVYPLTAYGAAARLVRSLCTPSKRVLHDDILYLVSDAGAEVRGMLERQLYGSMDTTLRTLVRVAVVLREWPELAEMLRRPKWTVPTPSPKLAVYAACMRGL